jgi:cell division protease FtsH
MTSPALGSGAGKTVPLDRLHGFDEAKRWAMDLKADLARYRQGQLAWQELSRGLLLAGPPGTAKTTLAGSIANFCGLGAPPFIKGA